MREALAVLEPMLEQPSGDPRVDGRVLVAYALALLMLERLTESIEVANEAVAMASDAMTEVLALGQRGIVQTYRGEHEASVRDNERATALARGVGPAALSGALMFLAQSHLFAGELDQAAERLAESERIGAPVDASKLACVETLHGDLAMALGQPHQALEHYANSLEAAEGREDVLQILFDLLGVAIALAVLGDDTDALEVAGLAEAQSIDVSGLGGLTAHMMGPESLVAVEERAGPVGAQLKARGHLVPAGSRVARACQLARARQPA
jgi:tetratricopeptide (TPR) repeat protein